MMRHAWAGQPAPALYVEWTWVKELGLSWPEVHGAELTVDEASSLAQMVGIGNDAAERRTRTQRGRAEAR